MFEKKLLWREYFPPEEIHKVLVVLECRVCRRFRAIEIAKRLELWSFLAVRAVIHFSRAKNVFEFESHSQIVEAW